MANSQTGRPTGHAELVVIGGGPGGYPAAFEAAELGMDVVLVNEEPQLGGVCLTRGCIPSKALLHVARLLFETREANRWGISFKEPDIDLERLREWKTQVVDGLTRGISSLGRKRGVKVIEARGTFLDSNTLQLNAPDGESSELTFDHAIVATGSRPVVPPPLRLDDPHVMDSASALDLPEIPNRLLVVGGGYVGLEMGTVYAALGANVTVVEMTTGLLPGADRDLVRPLQKRLEKVFERIDLNARVEGLTAGGDGIVAELGHFDSDGNQRDCSQETFDRVLIAVGRAPNSQDLGLENTGVQLDDQRFVQVNRRQRTSDPAILAIGDVAGEPMLAHKATREAKVAVECLAGEPAEFDNRAVPAVVFTDPEVAWCGLTETEANATGRKVQVGRFPWKASGRAVTLSRTEGLTKLVFDPEDGRLLGVGIVGVGAGELIAEGVLAVEMAAAARDVAETIHAHPTLSETVMESAEAFFGSSTHMHRS
jgi:dihydrolipoamide dehydrogenase